MFVSFLISFCFMGQSSRRKMKVLLKNPKLDYKLPKTQQQKLSGTIPCICIYVISYNYPQYPVRNYYYSHFTDEEISVRESKWLNWDLKQSRSCSLQYMMLLLVCTKLINSLLTGLYFHPTMCMETRVILLKQKSHVASLFKILQQTHVAYRMKPPKVLSIDIQPFKT